MDEIKNYHIDLPKPAQIIILIGFTVFFLHGAFHTEIFWMLDLCNLMLHEGGHAIFGLAGNETLGFLGGTLMQLIIPICVVVHFLKNKTWVSAAVALMWFGENFFHIAPYVKDARAQVLPLIGGGVHDWGYLLGQWGLLSHDQQIGNFLWGFGFIMIVFSSVWGVYCIYRQPA